MAYELVIRCYMDDTYRHVVAKRDTEDALYRTEAGVNINLGDDYYTEIEEVD